MKLADLNEWDYRKRDRVWFSWPWFDLRNSAALAVDFTKWLMPKAPTMVPVEKTEEGPYRARTVELKADFEENRNQYEARQRLESALAVVETYANGGVPIAPFGVYAEYSEPLTRLYWWIPDLIRAAGRTVYSVADQKPGLDAALAQALGIVQKFAVKAEAANAPDGAGNANLSNLVTLLGDFPVEKVEDAVIHRRFVDGLRGREADPDLRPAFEAAWMAEEYEFAYSLLEDPLLGASDDSLEVDTPEAEG